MITEPSPGQNFYLKVDHRESPNFFSKNDHSPLVILNPSADNRRMALEVIAHANHVVHTTISPFLAVAQLDAVRFL